jgi:hypothetical protein
VSASISRSPPAQSQAQIPRNPIQVTAITVTTVAKTKKRVKASFHVA